MSTITAILEPNADGTLHLPIPSFLRQGKVKIVASVEPVETPATCAKPGLWKNVPGPFWISPDFDAPLEDFKDYME